MFFCFIASILFALGLYLILAQAFNLPTLRNTKILLSVGKVPKDKPKTLYSLLILVASKISPYYHMDEYKKRKLTVDLTAAAIDLTPETYTVKAWLAASVFLLLSIPCFLIFPVISPAFIVLAVIVYFKESHRAADKVGKKRAKIERELPRFVGYIAQELQKDTGVIYLLEKYMNNAGEGLKEELTITVADMKTGNQEMALKRWDMRVGSGKLNEVIRGLILVLVGNNEERYFNNLRDTLQKDEKQLLLKEALKRPGKMRKYSGLILLVFILTYFVILGIVIIQNLDGIF